ncbi:MAG: MmgE/PrpD family protein [Solirubrobacteraceae bacterium]
MATAGLAEELARWATGLEPTEDDLALARRSLVDTVGVMFAARGDPLRDVFAELSEAGRWAALAHVLDFDDLHLPSTTHVSAVCVPVALASSAGDPGAAGAGADPARAYLAGAGVMARLGTALGWRHYTAGWHATCTAGAPGAAVAAAVARGLDADATARAIALAIPGAGGVQRAFGTAGKSLQVGFAAEAGVRAAALAAAGASADPGTLEQWMALVGGDPGAVELGGPAVPGGLAIKPFPCCYALQRPIAAVAGLSARPAADRIRRIAVRTPAASLAPLIHHSPQTGLEGKFSLEYGIAAALLDGSPGFDSFSDAAVQRPDAVRLAGTVQAAASDDGGDHLLTGEVEIELDLGDGERMSTTLALPPGAPERPMTDGELTAKLELCGAGDLAELSWGSAAQVLRQI